MALTDQTIMCIKLLSVPFVLTIACLVGVIAMREATLFYPDKHRALIEIFRVLLAIALLCHVLLYVFLIFLSGAGLTKAVIGTLYPGVVIHGERIDPPPSDIAYFIWVVLPIVLIVSIVFFIFILQAFVKLIAKPHWSVVKDHRLRNKIMAELIYGLLAMIILTFLSTL